MRCSLFTNSHFQMGVTIMGFAEHFGPCLNICLSLLLFLLAQVWQEGELTAFKHYSDIGKIECPDSTKLNENLQACCCVGAGFEDCCWHNCTLLNDKLPPNDCLKDVPNSRWINKTIESKNSFHAIQNVGKYILKKPWATLISPSSQMLDF